MARIDLSRPALPASTAFEGHWTQAPSLAWETWDALNEYVSKLEDELRAARAVVDAAKNLSGDYAERHFEALDEALQSYSALINDGGE
jgi:hypothetical protein